MQNLAEYLAARASQAGINPRDLATVMHYESGMNPNIWGGKGGNYYGLIQFGGPEREQYGVIPGKTDAFGQVDAAINFLRDRGFKPNMGLLDLYSTINAGSPGHYKASDRPGATVESHVANMAKDAAWADKFLSGVASPPPATPAHQAPLTPPLMGTPPAEPNAPASQPAKPVEDDTEKQIGGLLAALGQRQAPAQSRPSAPMGLLAVEDFTPMQIQSFAPAKMKRTKRFT